MTLKTIPTRVLRTPDAASDDAQRVSQVGFTRTNDAIAAVNNLLVSPFGSGQMLTVPTGAGSRTADLVIPAPGNLTFAHSLGRAPAGFVVVDAQHNGNAQIYRVPGTAAEDATTIVFSFATNCTVKIWIW